MQQFNIELDTPSTPLVLYAMQADSLSRFFQMTITQGGTPWTPPAGAAWTVRFGAPNMPAGWYDTIEEVGGSTHPAVIVSDNVAVVEIAEQAVSKPGQNILCVLVTDATGYQIASWRFQLLVTAVPGYDAPEATTYYNALTEQVAQTLANAQAAAASAVLSQSWAVGNTGTRDGENTNNAQYWSQQAAQSAQEAVGFRTMQGGAVLPINGDIDLTQPYPTKTGGSLTVTSAANRIDSVTVNGFTTQTGSGDASPSNVREIENAGTFNKLLVLNGTESISLYTDPSTGVKTYVFANIAPDWPPDKTYDALCTEYPFVDAASNAYAIRGPITDNGTVAIRDDSVSGVEELKQKFAANNAIIAYQSTNDTGKFYTGIEVEQGENYHCDIVELQAPLHEGDTLETSVDYNGELKCVETHVKKTYAFTGSENIQKSGLGANTFFVNFNDIAQNGQAGAVISNKALALSEEQCIAVTIWAVSGSGTNPNTLRISAPVTTVDEIKAIFTQFYNADSPFVVEYELKAPEVFADKPVEIKNPKGAFTISGESGTTCQVFMEPLQNGGVANAVENSLTLQDAEGETQLTYDGSAASVLELTKTIVGLSNVDNTADASKYVKGLVVNSTSTIEALPTGLYYYSSNTSGAPSTVDGMVLVLVYGSFGVQLAFPTNGGIFFRWAVSNFSEWARLDQ